MWILGSLGSLGSLPSKNSKSASSSGRACRRSWRVKRSSAKRGCRELCPTPPTRPRSLFKGPRVLPPPSVGASVVAFRPQLHGRARERGRYCCGRRGSEGRLPAMEASRMTLAGSDKSRYVQEHHEELASLLAQAQAAEGEKVAKGASRVLEDLLRYFKCEDDARAMGRLVPAAALENTSEAEPEKSVTVWGPMSTRNVTGGPARGDLEGTLRYLGSLGAATVVGEDSESGAESGGRGVGGRGIGYGSMQRYP